ncbi:MAG: metallophosphoesterase family protein [Chloroflexi bacterium]|nr:metallophosphoesterase family protein [Chloroflexota bacterium]
MRALLVSDIHSNLEAFRSVLTDARARGGWDVVWCLGDIVGYGPDPGPCLDLVRDLGGISVAGNHDWAVVGKVPLSDFNPYAAAAIRWTVDQISPEQSRYLANLTTTIRCDPFTLAHGSPREPIWEYLLDPEDARDNFTLLLTLHGLVGHSHVALAFRQETVGTRPRRTALTSEEAVSLSTGRWIVNPGSVGQPRDGDPRAAYALYDDAARTITGYRVAYDIPAVLQKMAAAGLPTFLAQRLSVGR